MALRCIKAVGLVALGLVGACTQREQARQAAPPAGPARGSPEWKIENAMSAAPPAIARAATILDFPSSPDGPTPQLRAGTNGWTCVPDDPNTPGDDPVCGDSVTFGWYGAWMQHTAPRIDRVGLAYMLQGATDPSNTDPFKTKPDSGQEWVVTGPHVMIFVPDPRVFRGITTDWKSGGPYIMYANTPYAHLMLPVAPAEPVAAEGGL
jgi:hypothetical protein